MKFGVEHNERVSWMAREVLPHESAVRNWLMRRTSTIAAIDVNDVIQEAYARIWSADHAGIGNPRAYFFTTARNLVSEVLRRSRIVAIDVVADIEAENIAVDEFTAERRTSGREEVRWLMGVIENLPARCREAFLLKKMDGYSQSQIAGRMGVAESTVEKHLSKALRLIMQQKADLENRTTIKTERDEKTHGRQIRKR